MFVRVACLAALALGVTSAPIEPFELDDDFFDLLGPEPTPQPTDIPQPNGEVQAALDARAEVMGWLATTHLSDQVNKYIKELTMVLPPDSAWNKFKSGPPRARDADLVGLLINHVIPGLHPLKDLKDGDKLKNLAGHDFIVTVKDGKTFINGTEILNVGGEVVQNTDNKQVTMFSKDVIGGLSAAQNQYGGPKEGILALAMKEPEMAHTIDAIVKAGMLNGVMSDPGPITIFSPKNSAFEKLNATNTSLPTDPNQEAPILKHHIALGYWPKDLLTKGLQLPTLDGTMITIGIEGGSDITLDGPEHRVVGGPVVGANGIIYYIDNVIMPGSNVALASDTPAQ
eukprot:comp18432_c0_seq1/m.19686 comp18432_c0_seq1/g.19686  ORF comp18432_c0_seq1/g.19686 comp18432_c0_seq1/m.19686 type:complete len:341 (-) comp18432_c0_seq1:697-1719(-)